MPITIRDNRDVLGEVLADQNRQAANPYRESRHGVSGATFTAIPQWQPPAAPPPTPTPIESRNLTATEIEAGVESWKASNKDLAPYEDYVGFKTQQLVATNGNLDPLAALEQAGHLVREKVNQVFEAGRASTVGASPDVELAGHLEYLRNAQPKSVGR